MPSAERAVKESVTLHLPARSCTCLLTCMNAYVRACMRAGHSRTMRKLAESIFKVQGSAARMTDMYRERVGLFAFDGEDGRAEGRTMRKGRANEVSERQCYRSAKLGGQRANATAQG